MDLLAVHEFCGPIDRIEHGLGRDPAGGFDCITYSLALVQTVQARTMNGSAHVDHDLGNRLGVTIDSTGARRRLLLHNVEIIYLASAKSAAGNERRNSKDADDDRDYPRSRPIDSKPLGSRSILIKLHLRITPLRFMMRQSTGCNA